MTDFENREKAEERLHASKEELEFKANAKRDRIIGLWAAGLLGLEGEKAEAYAAALVREDLQKSGDEDVVAKLKSDFAAAKVEISDHQLQREMAEALSTARKELGL